MGFLGVYGHVNIDYLLRLKELPAAERTVPITESQVRLGGTGGNIARAAAALGVPTSLAACVGDDFPVAYRELLESAHIDLTDLRHVPGSTPKVWVLTVPDGPQSCVIDQGVMNDGVARPALDYTWLNSSWVHFTTGDPTDWLRAAKEARRAGKQVAFDPGQELAYRYSSSQLEAFLNQSHLFVCNESEVKRVLHLLGYGDVRQLLDHTPRVLVTRGPQGVRLVSDAETLDVPACPLRGSVGVDPTGAGDVFRAGAYAALYRGGSWLEALRTGAVAASLFLEQRGNRFPSWSDVVARREEWAP